MDFSAYNMAESSHNSDSKSEEGVVPSEDNSEDENVLSPWPKSLIGMLESNQGKLNLAWCRMQTSVIIIPNFH